MPCSPHRFSWVIVGFGLGLGLVASTPVVAQSSDAPAFRQRQEDRTITRRQPGDRSLERLNGTNETRRRLLERQQRQSRDGLRNVTIIPKASRGSVVVNR